MMNLSVHVIPRSSREEIIEKNGIWKIYLHESPERGKANEKVCELIARKLEIPKSKVKIVRGETSKNKWIEVLP